MCSSIKSNTRKHSHLVGVVTCLLKLLLDWVPWESPKHLAVGMYIGLRAGSLGGAAQARAFCQVFADPSRSGRRRRRRYGLCKGSPSVAEASRV